MEDRVVGEAGRPAVGAGGLGVDLVVELAEDADEAVVVDLAVPALDGLAGPELFQHVVHLGEGQAGMRRLLPLAVGVEPLAEVAQAGAGGLVGVGEGEGVEAAGLVVARVIPVTEPTARRDRPHNMNVRLTGSPAARRHPGQ